MHFEISEEHRMLKDLVARFVKDELMPLEAGVMLREAEGKGLGIGAEEHARLDKKAHDLGLFGLDAPEDVGGSDLPSCSGGTLLPYVAQARASGWKAVMRPAMVAGMNGS